MRCQLGWTRLLENYEEYWIPDMAVVEVQINQRMYQVACDDGQEEHLMKLAGDIDQRVRDLSATMGQVGDARLILMAGLLLADELTESLETIESMSQKKIVSEPTSEDVGNIIENTANRLMRIAEGLEKA